MRAGETSVLLVPDDVWTALPKTVAAIRDKVVVQVDRDKVTRLDVESPQGPVFSKNPPTVSASVPSATREISR